MKHLVLLLCLFIMSAHIAAARPVLALTQTPTPPTSCTSDFVPNVPEWFCQIPPKLHDFLELLYISVFLFERPTNLQYLLTGFVPTPTPSTAQSNAALNDKNATPVITRTANDQPTATPQTSSLPTRTPTPVLTRTPTLRSTNTPTPIRDLQFSTPTPTAYRPTIVPTINPTGIVIQPSGSCVAAGCSGELCVSASVANDIVSTCLYRPEYACLAVSRCEMQPSGTCGWTKTSEYNICLGGIDPYSGYVTQ